MTRIGRVAHLLGAVGGAIVCCAGLSSPAGAQAGTVERSVDVPASSGNQTTRQPAKKTTDWTINDALPKDSKAVANDIPTASNSQFGRLNLDTGTVGLTTQSQLKEGQFSDGRRVPGLEAEKRNPSSYFGLSVSVPTNSNSLIPVPLFPRRE